MNKIFSSIFSCVYSVMKMLFLQQYINSKVLLFIYKVMELDFICKIALVTFPCAEVAL